MEVISLVKIKEVDGIPCIIIPLGVICLRDDIVKEITKKPDFAYGEDSAEKPDFTYLQNIKTHMSLKEVLRELRKRFEDE